MHLAREELDADGALAALALLGAELVAEVLAWRASIDSLAISFRRLLIASLLAGRSLAPAALPNAGRRGFGKIAVNHKAVIVAVEPVPSQ